VAAYAGDLLRTAYLVVWDLATAEDLVQDCLFQIARRWPRVRSMEYPTAYARRVLVNLALAGAKRRGRHRSELEWHDRLAEEADESAELRARDGGYDRLARRCSLDPGAASASGARASLFR